MDIETHLVQLERDFGAHAGKVNAELGATATRLTDISTGLHNRLTAMDSNLTANMEVLRRDLSEVLVQARATNGRVTRLEGAREAEDRHSGQDERRRLASVSARAAVFGATTAALLSVLLQHVHL